jgi:phenylacetate-CoA ligase
MIPSSVAALRRLWLHPSAERATIERFRNRQLRRLIRHAYASVPHYRDLLDRHGIRPEDIRSVDDLAAVPVTSRRELQARTAREVVARDVDPARLIVRRTSGRSGQPLSIRRTWFEERLLGGFRWRALHAMGWRPTDRHAEIEEVGPTHPHDSQFVHRALQGIGLCRQARIHALQAPDAIRRALRAFGPDIVTGYAGALTRVAQTLSDADRATLRVRFAATHSEVLTPQMRQQIATGFAAPVYEIYDCNECNMIAWQCVCSGALHVCDDAVVVEILADGRPVAPGERGEVVVTSLHSFAMPIIRYRLGDIATRGRATCPCGQPFSTLHRIQGRMADYFPLPGGRLLHPYEIVAIVGNATPWLREYQLTQEREDVVVLHVVPWGTPSASEVDDLRARVAAILGGDVTLRLEIVAALRVEPNAKFRVCRSMVTSAYDGFDWDHATGRR